MGAFTEHGKSWIQKFAKERLETVYVGGIEKWSGCYGSVRRRFSAFVFFVHFRTRTRALRFRGCRGGNSATNGEKLGIVAADTEENGSIEVSFKENEFSCHKRIIVTRKRGRGLRGNLLC